MNPDRKRGPLDDEFERGYVPCDEPPGIEEGEYQRWKEAGGKINPQLQEGAMTPNEMMERLRIIERRNAQIDRDLMHYDDMRILALVPALALVFVVGAIVALAFKLWNMP